MQKENQTIDLSPCATVDLPFVIFEIKDGNKTIDVRLENDSVWLTQSQMSELFATDRTSIVKHIKQIYLSGELEECSTCAKIAQVQLEGNRKVKREQIFFNLDVIISVGYRVNSLRGTQFRIWANSILKEYLTKGYAINERRLLQKQQEIADLKVGIRLLNRAIEEQNQESENSIFEIYANGLSLLDDYDHESLDQNGVTKKDIYYPDYDEYMEMIHLMYSDFQSEVFAKPKDDSFHSSINQIAQSFGSAELYPSLEEKAAMLLYLIVKNHSFVDGNKRIGAACFIYFLSKNKSLKTDTGIAIISNEALAAMTLFIAMSRTEEMETVKRFVISVLNRNRGL